MTKNKNIKKLCYISLFTVLICICSWLCLPFPIPFTLQTFAIFCALLCLGGKKGTVSVCVYLLMGAAGLPVFSGFTGGIGTLFGSSGGYLWGFLLSGIVYICFEKISLHNLINAFISMTVCYVAGTLWFFTIYSESSGIKGFLYTLCICVFPFIIPDTIKILLAYYISERIKKHLPR